jgi:FKBP-type peptidyl-prolyl cis-trans isomerase
VQFLREGEPGKQQLEEGCPTFVQYVGRLMDGSIFDTTYVV